MTLDEALTEYQDAWLAGMAPSTALYLDRVDLSDREALEQAIGHWLGYDAPTVEPHPARMEELLADPLVQSLMALEDAWWAERD